MNFIDTELDFDDGNFERRLAALPVPPMPADLAGRCRGLVAAGVAPGSGRRRTGRRALFGMAVMVAAAAAMLAYRLTRPALPAVTSMAATPAAAQTVVADRTPAAPAAALPPRSTPPAKAIQPATPKPFTVQVQPLQNSPADAPVRSSVQRYYAGLLDGLRSIPGLTLIDEPPQDARDPGPDYLIKVSSRGPSDHPNAPIHSEVEIEIQQSKPHGAGRTYASSFRSLMGVSVQSDPEEMAAIQVELLRAVVFPYESANLARLRSRLNDQSLNFMMRLNALVHLKLLMEREPAARKEGGPWNAEVIRGALDLASSATSASARTNIWAQLRGLRDPALVQPLIDQSRVETDDDARFQLVNTLAEDFATNPAAVAALESIARTDSSQLVRMVAQSALSGGTGWREYAVSALSDQTLTDAERITPIGQIAQRMRPGVEVREFTELMDGKVVSALTELLPRTLGDPKLSVVSLQLLSFAMASKDPAVIDLLVFASQPSQLQHVRGGAINALGARHGADPRARAVLEKAAADDPDPLLRQLASNALSSQQALSQ